MIERLDIKDYENKEQLVWVGVINKLNQLVDAVNGILNYAPLEMAMKAEPGKCETPAENVLPGYVTTTYMTDGHTKGYYGQNGASIRTDRPLPAGYVITIREPKTKGDNNE